MKANAMHIARRWAHNLLVAITSITFLAVSSVTVFVGMFPVLLCNGLDYLNCISIGLGFFGILAAMLVVPVGLAILALFRSSFIAQAYLLAYPIYLIGVGRYPYENMINLVEFREGLSFAGLLTLILVLFCHTGPRHR